MSKSTSKSGHLLKFAENSATGSCRNLILVAFLIVSFSVTTASAQSFVTPLGIPTSKSRLALDEPEEAFQAQPKLYNPGGGRPPARNNVAIGFAFLRPDWEFDGFKTLVPSAVAADLGLPGEVTVDNFEWQPDLNFGFELQGPSIFNNEILLKGSRIATSGNVTQVVNGREVTTAADVDIVMVGVGPNPFEVPRDPENDIYSSFKLGIQTRYLEIGQSFVSSYENGNGMEAALSAKGQFKGVGLGLSGDYTYLLTQPQEGFINLVDIEFISGIDTTIALGTNNRTSSLSAETGIMATSFVDTVKKDGTEFVYGGELYTGFRFLLDVDDETVDGNDDRKMWIDAVLYGNLWSNVGLLNPRDPNLSDNDLYVYGFIIMGGMYY